MMERKYSVAEIDDMRRDIGTLLGPGTHAASERDRKIEDRLRTYMANGTEPEELSAAAEYEIAQRYKFQTTSGG